MDTSPSSFQAGQRQNLNLTSACSCSKLYLHLCASLPTAHEMEKYTYFTNYLWRYTALPWDACHKPHTLSGDSVIGFVWVESEQALSSTAWQFHLVRKCKNPHEFQRLIFIFQEHTFSCPLSSSQELEPTHPLAVSIHQSFISPGNSHCMETRSKEKMLEISCLTVSF